MADVLLIEGCNFVDYPKGGQLSSALNLIRIFGDRLALVGWSTDGAPVGSWFRRRLDGRLYDCFNIGRRVPRASRPPVPDRLFTYLMLRRHRRAIFAHAPRDVFIQAPEVLLAVHDLPWSSICYRFAGIDNPLRNARYAVARPLAGVFLRSWVQALQSVDLLLASADGAAIGAFARSAGDASLASRIIPFPTRFDDSVFAPGDQAAARAALGIPSGCVCLVCVGRLNRAKGWDLLLRAMQLFRRRQQDALLLFVGDGEDRALLLRQASALGLAEAVRCTGFISPQAVAQHLHAADLYLCGSVSEGWSIAMIEALACGLPIASTEVSGASDLVAQGENGFIVAGRDPSDYAAAIDRALALPDAASRSLELARPYARSTLAADLGRLWPPLREVREVP